MIGVETVKAWKTPQQVETIEADRRRGWSEGPNRTRRNTITDDSRDVIESRTGASRHFAAQPVKYFKSRGALARPQRAEPAQVDAIAERRRSCPRFCRPPSAIEQTELADHPAWADARKLNQAVARCSRTEHHFAASNQIDTVSRVILREHAVSRCQREAFRRQSDIGDGERI